MRSITDLNGIGLNTNDYSDNRDPSVTFNVTSPINQALSCYQGAPHTLPVGINVTEIINYPLVGMEYIIDCSNTSLECYVQWSSLPETCVLTIPQQNVWKLTGITSAVDWNAVKSPTVIINEGVEEDFVYDVTINYLSTSNKSWTVSVHTLLYDILSDATEFAFEDGIEQLVTGHPLIYDYSQTQTNWTVTVIPSITSGVVTGVRTTGFGGTSSYNSTTQQLTITGSKTQVNSHLNSMYYTFSPTNTLDITLTYFAINETSTRSKTVIQSLICETVNYLSFASGNMTYSEDTPFAFTGLPTITDNHITYSSVGNTQKVVSINQNYDTQWTSNGNVITSTTESKFGGSSIYFTSLYNLGKAAETTALGGDMSGDFTVELWIRLSSFTGNDKGLITQRNYSSSGTGTWGLAVSSDRILRWNDLQNITVINTAAGVFNWDTWTHVAVVRTSGTVKIYTNGVQQASGTMNTSFVTTQPYRLGDWDSSGSNELVNSFLDEVRISSVARYTSAFTPPTVAFTTDAFTISLLHGDGSNGGQTFYEEAYGVAISNTVSKIGGSSIALTGGSITVPYSTDWRWYDGNFTCEYWVYNVTNRGTGGGSDWSRHLGMMEPTGSSNYWSFGTNSIGKATFYWYSGTTNALTGTTTIPLKTWTHIAVTFTKLSNTLNIYVNGVLDASVVVSNTPQFSTSVPLTLGRYSGAVTNCHVDEVRLSNIVRYTGTFTPSTTVFVADDNTNLLLHGDGTNGGVISDSSVTYAGPSYTYTITSSDTASLRSATSSGTGGTFTYSNGVITMIGNKAQVNSRLTTITATPASDYTSNFTITSTVVTPANKTKSVNQTISCVGVHDEITNIVGDRYYDANLTNLLFPTNIPQITDLDTSSPSYTITLTSAIGKFGTTTANAVTNYTFTGTKAQVNALFSTIVFVPNTDISSTSSFVYTQTKGSVLQVTSTNALICSCYTVTPATNPADGTVSMSEGGTYTIDPVIAISSINSALNNASFVIDISTIPNAILVWSALDASITKTVVNGVYTLTGIDSIAKWNSAKNPVLNLDNVYNGTGNIICSIKFQGSNGLITRSFKRVATISDVYPLSTVTSPSSYYSGSNTTIAFPVLYDNGYQNPTWTVNIVPTTTAGITWTVGGTGGTVTQSGNQLSIVGTPTQVNSRLSNVLIRGDQYYDYTYTLNINASNNINTETATRSKSMYSNNATVSSAVGGNTTYSLNTTSPIVNAPTITTTVTGNCTYTAVASPSTAGFVYFSEYGASGVLSSTYAVFNAGTYPSGYISGPFVVSPDGNSWGIQYKYTAFIGGLVARVVYNNGSTIAVYDNSSNITSTDPFGDSIDVSNSRMVISDKAHPHNSNTGWIYIPNTSFYPSATGSFQSVATGSSFVAGSLSGRAYFWKRATMEAQPPDTTGTALNSIVLTGTAEYMRFVYSSTYGAYDDIMIKTNDNRVFRYNVTNPTTGVFSQAVSTASGVVVNWFNATNDGSRFVTCSSGTVKVYIQSGSSYVVEQSITAAGIANFGTLDNSCAITSDGTYIAVGDYAVYKRTGSTWAFYAYINTGSYNASRNCYITTSGTGVKVLVVESPNIKTYTMSLAYATTMTDTKANINAAIPSLKFKPATGQTGSFSLIYQITAPDGKQSFRNQTITQV
jgi:hypothetical protein